MHAALTACARASFNSIEIASESIFFSAEARVPSNHVAFIRRVRATVRHGNRTVSSFQAARREIIARRQPEPDQYESR